MFISKHKNRYYYLYYFDQTGKRKSITTRTKLKSEALQFLKEFQNKPKLKPKKRELLIWSELHDIIIRDLQIDNYSGETVLIYKRVFKNFARLIGHMQINLITETDVQRFKELRATEVKTATVNIELRTIKAIFNKASNFVERNPAKNLKQIRIEQRPLKAFTQIEIELIRETMKPDKLMSLIFEIAIYTGLRLSEIVFLRFANVNLSERIISIENTEIFKTKTRQNRKVPVSEKLFEILRELYYNPDGTMKMISPNQFIFSPNNVKCFDKRYISRRFKRHLRRLHLPECYSFHSLRHSFASTLINKGVPAFHVQRILGHSTIQTTEQYVSVRIDDLKKSVNLS